MVELDDEYEEVLSGCRFLEPADANVNEVIDSSAGRRAHYLVLGYPKSKFARKAGHLVTPDPLIVTSLGVAPQIYERAGVIMATHVVLQHQRKRMLSLQGRVISPSLDGISGGGVFRFRGTLDEPQVELVAVIIEARGDHVNAIVGTRIGLPLQLFRHAYPELAGELPKPTNVRINITNN